MYNTKLWNCAGCNVARSKYNGLQVIGHVSYKRANYSNATSITNQKLTKIPDSDPELDIVQKGIDIEIRYGSGRIILHNDINVSDTWVKNVTMCTIRR